MHAISLTSMGLLTCLVRHLFKNQGPCKHNGAFCPGPNPSKRKYAEWRLFSKAVGKHSSFQGNVHDIKNYFFNYLYRKFQQSELTGGSVTEYHQNIFKYKLSIFRYTYSIKVLEIITRGKANTKAYKHLFQVCSCCFTQLIQLLRNITVQCC